jgi:hypothetical protein
MGPPPSQVTPRYFAAFWTRSPLPLMRPCNPGGSSLATDQDTAALLPCTPVKSGRTFRHALTERFPRLQIYSRPLTLEPTTAPTWPDGLPPVEVSAPTHSSPTERESHYDSRQSFRGG